MIIVHLHFISYRFSSYVGNAKLETIIMSYLHMESDPMYEALRIFTTVVEQGSLNRASLILNLTQPALSRKIVKLEEQLGVSLFERKGKRLELTRVGRISYEMALEMLHLQRKFMQKLAEYQTAGKSSITIGASLTTLQSTLPELITLFTKENPGTEIKAVTGKTHEIVTLVKERKVDVGLVASRVDHSGITCVPLFDDHLQLVCPKSYLLNMGSFPSIADRGIAGKERKLPGSDSGQADTDRGLSDQDSRLDITDLSGMPMILFSKGTWYRVLTDELFLHFGIAPDVQMEIDSFEAIIRLLSPCDAVTLLPKSYLRPSVMEDNHLIVTDIAELQQTTRTTSLIYGDAESLNASTWQLIDRAKRFYPYHN